MIAGTRNSCFIKCAFNKSMRRWETKPLKHLKVLQRSLARLQSKEFCSIACRNTHRELRSISDKRLGYQRPGIWEREVCVLLQLEVHRRRRPEDDRGPI